MVNYLPTKDFINDEPHNKSQYTHKQFHISLDIYFEMPSLTYIFMIHPFGCSARKSAQPLNNGKFHF